VKEPVRAYNVRMSARKLKARAELQKREWVEVELELDDKGAVTALTWNALGCHKLLEAAGRATAQMLKKNLSDLQWQGASHWDLLLTEVIDRLQNKFQIPIADAELCHCRKIPTAVVDEAIVLGAHTPEKVRAWTTASSGCGTCRPDVEKLIDFRLKKTS
jgi:bacterioferritin-associated ferredoxin